MARRSDYVRGPRPQHRSPALFDDPYDDPTFISLDRHSSSPFRDSSFLDVPYSSDFPRVPSDPFMSERADSRVFERRFRGYNPSYYGETAC